MERKVSSRCSASPLPSPAATYHEALKVGPPPLRQQIRNLPISRSTLLLGEHLVALASLLRRSGTEAVVKARLEAVNVGLVGLEVVAGPGYCPIGVSEPYEKRCRTVEARTA
jgi:hypothetical protein